MLLSQNVLTENYTKNAYRLGRDVSAFIYALFVTLIFAFWGYAAVLLIFSQGSTVSLLLVDPYAGCRDLPDYAIRAAVLCRPILWQAAILWLSAYTQFEKALLTLVFSIRGLSLGIAVYLLLLSPAAREFAFLPVAYTAVTAVFLLLTSVIHTETGARSAGESFIMALVAAGAASGIFIVISLLYSL